MRTTMPFSRLPGPGLGLRDHMQRYGRRVLNAMTSITSHQLLTSVSQAARSRCT